MCVDTYQGSLHLTHPLDLPAEHLASLLFHCLPQLVLQPLSLSVTKIPTALSCAWMCSFSNFCFKPSEPLLAFKQLVLMACPVILQNSCTDEAGAGLLAKFCSRRLSIDCGCFCHRFSSFPLNKLFFFFFLRLWLISRVLKWLWQFCQALSLLFGERIWQAPFFVLITLGFYRLCRDWLYKKLCIVDLDFLAAQKIDRTLAFHSISLTH